MTGSIHTPIRLQVSQITLSENSVHSYFNAGKKASAGTILLYCLNLPPHLRYRPENMFIAAITPPPYAPNITTISHVLDPIITSVLKYNSAPGQSVSTFKHPDGVSVMVKAVPLIADLEGNNKVSGFLSHAADMYCSFCLSHHHDMEDLNLHLWTLRNGTMVKNQAEAWRNLPTKKAQEENARETGVRWTSMHRLPYWDPVDHTILGTLYNWEEGILQNHLRVLWGIGRDDNTEQKLKDIDFEEHWTDTDVSESASELEELRQEAAEHSAEMAHAMAQMLPPDPSSPSPVDHPSSPSTPTQGMFLPDSDTQDLDLLDPDFIPQHIPSDDPPFSFSDDQLHAIQECISNITLPTWVQRPPGNLGEPSHGKLRAHEYLTLFICIFPLIIPEFWHGANISDVNYDQLQCFHHLVSATNIISSFTTSFVKADQYTQHYIHYRQLIQRLFPQFSSKPNHHYAMHNGALMKWWGPMPSSSEYFGERVNGMLQSV